jgi:hypothetical protein
MESFLKNDLKKIHFQNRLLKEIDLKNRPLTKIDLKKESIIWIIDFDKRPNTILAFLTD